MLFNSVDEVFFNDRGDDVTIESIYKYGKEYITFSLCVKKGSKGLSVIFSGVDQKPSRNSFSYYKMRDSLKCSVLHVKDNFGNHGCYFLRISKEKWIQNAVRDLVAKVIDLLKVDKHNVYLLGTSKGGTEALITAFNLGYGKVVAGEPQICLGNYLMARGWEGSNVFKNIVYTMCGDILLEDKDFLNKVLLSDLESLASGFDGSVTLIHGDTGYYPIHIEPFLDFSKSFDFGVNVIHSSFDKHNDVIPIFQDYVHELDID